MLRAWRWQKYLLDERLAVGFAVLGGVVFLFQSWIYAHNQSSLLDEGAYLNKGYLFATGEYLPYQDYGAWTNHMPLVFLIPGYVQQLFGSGLRTGRYLSIVLGALILLGLWIIARRFSNQRWASLVVWAMALNPAPIKLYSLANSQSLLAGMLVWVLVFLLGDKQAWWKVALGSFLAGIMLMTRVNLAPVLLLLIGYVYWQFGGRMALLASVMGITPVLVGHALYWPGILRIWAHWIPVDLLPFLKPWGHPLGALPSWNPSVTFATRFLSFWQGMRYHFVTLFTILTTWLLLPHKGSWKNLAQYKITAFLSTLFGVLFLSHLWAALGNEYCVFCFPVYLSFFSPIGLILGVLTFVIWRRELSQFHQAIILFLVLVMAAGIGFGAYNEIGGRLIDESNVRSLLSLQIPRFRDWKIMPGQIELWGVLANRFHLEYGAIIQGTHLFFRVSISILISVIGGFMLILAATSLRKYLAQRTKLISVSTGYLSLILFMVVGLLFSPSRVLGGGYHTYDCGGDVIRSYEQAGAHLAKLIPAGATIYWEGGNSAVPLLYLPGVNIFPAQLNGDYSYRLGGDPDALARYGFWSIELAQSWADQADYVLIEESKFEGWLSEFVSTHEFDELEPSPPTVGCRADSVIHIFQRK